VPYDDRSIQADRRWDAAGGLRENAEPLEARQLTTFASERGRTAADGNLVDRQALGAVLARVGLTTVYESCTAGPADGRNSVDASIVPAGAADYRGAAGGASAAAPRLSRACNAAAGVARHLVQGGSPAARGEQAIE
jgi:hypothetical protein